jgi:integrase
VEIADFGVGSGNGNSTSDGDGNSSPSYDWTPGAASTVLAFEEKTTIDVEGWHEKLLRRTKSQTTVHAYDAAVKRFKQFVGERMGLTLGQAIDRIRSEDADVYEVLDRFVGWANSLQVCVRGSDSAIQLMPHTIHRYVEGTKSFLRYLGVEISNERVKQKVTLPVAEEIADVPLERKVIRTILMSDAPLMFRTGCAIMKDAGTRIGETLQIRVKDIHLDEDPVRIVIRKETTKASKHGRIEREIFITLESAELVSALILRKFLAGDKRLLSYSTKDFRETLYRVLPKMGLGQRIEGHRYWQVHPHVFRKFFFTNAVGAMGETAAHAMMGHSFYLSTYFRRPLEDRRADYRKAACNLIVMDANSSDRVKEARLEALRVVASSLGLSGPFGLLTIWLKRTTEKWLSRMRFRTP